MQGGHDDLQRRLVLVLGMRIDRDAAAVVGHGQEAVRIERDFDEGRVPGDRLVHGVVDYFRKQVVQRLVVGAADIHSRPPPNRLQPLEDFDCRRVVTAIRLRFGFLRRAGGLAGGSRSCAAACQSAEEIAVVVHVFPCSGLRCRISFEYRTRQSERRTGHRGIECFSDSLPKRELANILMTELPGFLSFRVILG